MEAAFYHVIREQMIHTIENGGKTESIKCGEKKIQISDMKKKANVETYEVPELEFIDSQI